MVIETPVFQRRTDANIRRADIDAVITQNYAALVDQEDLNRLFSPEMPNYYADAI